MVRLFWLIGDRTGPSDGGARRAPTVYSILLVFTSLVFLSACSSKPESRIIGKWRSSNPNDGGPSMLEFIWGGTVALTDVRQQTLAGKYTFPEPDRLKIEFLPPDERTLVFLVAISETTLVLSGENGSAAFTRVK